jgi:hypothetical protein
MRESRLEWITALAAVVFSFALPAAAQQPVEQAQEQEDVARDEEEADEEVPSVPAEEPTSEEPVEGEPEVVPPPPVGEVEEEEEDDDDDIEIEAAVGQGLIVRAGDAFSLQIRARIQFRIALSMPTDGAIAAGAEGGVHDDFMIRRLRLVLQGNVIAPQLRYYIQFGFSQLDMEADLLIPLRDAYITWQPHRDIGVRFGQMKVPYGLQRVVSSSALQFTDRSIVTSELNLDRDVGFYLLSEDFLGLGGMLQYQIGVFGGQGRNRFGGVDKALFAARIVVNPFGGFDQLIEADLARSPDPRLGIGISGAYNIDSNRQRSTHSGSYDIGLFDFAHAGADLHFKWLGFSLMSEVMMRWTDEPLQSGEVDGMPVTEASRSAWGWFAQAGYVMPQIPLELAARYGEIRPFDNDASADFFLQREVGGAVSYYVEQHWMKVQLDYFYLFGRDPSDERHQVRLQVQIFF